MAKRIKMGIHGLDGMLKGGIPEGKAVLLSGSCGTGKTTLAMQYLLHGVKTDEPGLYINFEQDKNKLLDDMQSVGFGDIEKHEKADKIRVIGGNISDVLWYKKRTSARMQDIVDEVKDVVTEIGAKRVVLDSINLFTMLFENETEQRLALSELVHSLNKLGVTTLLTCELRDREVPLLSWYGFEEYVVDGVIKLHRFNYRNYFKRAVSIVKMRGVNHEDGAKLLEITKDGIVVHSSNELTTEINNCNY